MVGIFGIRISFLEDRFSGAMLNFRVVFWKLSHNKTPSSALAHNLPHFGWVIQPSCWNPQHEIGIHSDGVVSIIFVVYMVYLMSI